MTKTDIPLISLAPGIDFPSSLGGGRSDIPFSSAARNLGVVFDSQLALKEQVNKLAYREIRRIRLIRQQLSLEATKTRFLSCSLSLGLIIVMLTLLRFSSIKFRRMQLLRSPHLQRP